MILTITLNPALDRLVFVENLKWREKNIAIETHTFTSGKGFNVAKALGALAIETTALGFVGLADLDLYKQRLESRYVRVSLVPIAATRTNIKIIERNKNQETEVNESGATVLPNELERLRHAYLDHVSRAEYVTMSGSIAPGVPKTIYAELVQEAARYGVRAIVDASGESLRAAIEARPFALRLNHWELQELMGHALPSVDDSIAAARSLLERGIEYVVVSSGADGALLAHRTGTWFAHVPRLQVVNAIGSGDVMSAGLVYGWLRGNAPEVVLRWATTLASASVRTLESGAVEVTTAKELESQVVVDQVP
jgi:1-phosphofructokinase